MRAQYGTVDLVDVDLTRFDRETVWTEDGADLLTIRQTIGMVATYSPGGYPRLTSATSLSPDTLDTLGKPPGVMIGDASALAAGAILGPAVGGAIATAIDSAIEADAKVALDKTASVLASTPRGRAPGETARINTTPRLETDEPGDHRLDDAQFRSGPETDAELRARLWLPRQKFILWAYNKQTGKPIRWLESPRPGFTTDAANGPKPLSVDVVGVSGEPESVVVHFQIQTETSPCPTGSDRLVLSHRWQMSHTSDENNYVTRVIKGQIVFNGAVMRHQNVNPDFVRAQFIHPIPLGMERKVPEIIASPDGLTIRYTITDTEPKIVFDPGNSGATQIQIVEKLVQSVELAMTTRQEIDQVAGDIARAVLRSAAGPFGIFW